MTSVIVAPQHNRSFVAGVRVGGATTAPRRTALTTTTAFGSYRDNTNKSKNTNPSGGPGFSFLAATSRRRQRHGRSNRARCRARAAAEGTTASTAADPADVYAIRDTTDDGEEVVSTAAWIEAREGETSAGVYGLYDTSEKLQYVGYTQDVVDTVQRHLDAVGNERANKVRVAVFANKSMATRANLRAEADRWIGEWVGANGGEDSAVPPGNQAMYAADWTLQPPEVWEDAAPAAAVKGAGVGAPSVGPDGKVVSPFAASAAGGDQTAAGVAGAAATGEEEEEEEPLDPNRELLPLTMENVDEALNEVRPYLIADGGNVDVVGIEDGIVAVRMNGACGSCSSSTATLKGGIEKHLVKVFGGEAVKEVVNLDSSEPGGALSLSKDAVVAHMDKLSGAIHNYGGAVEVLGVEDGIVSLEFSGPVALAQSIASSIKGKFPLVKECKIKQVG